MSFRERVIRECLEVYALMVRMNPIAMLVLVALTFILVAVLFIGVRV